ncbi:MAG: hypothetical protein R3E76_15405 [Planctomycetota bacterium]
MGDGEGSKAMTIYIVACFLLAMVALVGYKYKNEEREELSTEYVNLAGQFADMSAAYAPNINDYYRKGRGRADQARRQGRARPDPRSPRQDCREAGHSRGRR